MIKICGLFGYFGNIKKGKHKQVVRLMKALALATQVRGRDSFGYYACSDNSEYSEKQAVSAEEFLVTDNLMQEAIEAGAYIFLGHDRAASIGALAPQNAHPFIGENIVQIHNGTCHDVFDIVDDAILAKMEGETDSEAIMWLFDKMGPEHYKTYQVISQYALVQYHFESKRIYLARDFHRPLCIYDLRKAFGIRVFASTQAIFDRAAKACGINGMKGFALKSFNLYYGDISDGEVHRLNRYKKVRTVQSVDDEGEVYITEHAKNCKPFKDNSTPVKQVIVRKKQTATIKQTPEHDIPPYLELYYEEQERKRKAQERVNASMVVHSKN